MSADREWNELGRRLHKELTDAGIENPHTLTQEQILIEVARLDNQKADYWLKMAENAPRQFAECYTAMINTIGG